MLVGPDFRQGRLVVVITADEDDHSGDNRVLTVVATKDMPGHQVVGTPLTHLSLSRLYAEVLHFAPLRGAAGAPSLADRLPPRPHRLLSALRAADGGSARPGPVP